MFATIFLLFVLLVILIYAYFSTHTYRIIKHQGVYKCQIESDNFGFLSTTHKQWKTISTHASIKDASSAMKEYIHKVKTEKNHHKIIVKKRFWGI